MPCPRYLLLLALSLAACRPPSAVDVEKAMPAPDRAGYAWTGTAGEDLAVALVPETVGTLRDSIDQVLASKGYRLRPPQRAAWQLHYELRVNPRVGTMPTGDATLQPRMVCGPMDCQVEQHWQDADSAGLDAPRYRYREAVVRLVLVDTTTQRVAWKGSTTREVAADGPLDARALAEAAAQLASHLPEVRAARR
jgi:hypothetical protein